MIYSRVSESPHSLQIMSNMGSHQGRRSSGRETLHSVVLATRKPIHKHYYYNNLRHDVYRFIHWFLWQLVKQITQSGNQIESFGMSWWMYNISCARVYTRTHARTYHTQHMYTYICTLTYTCINTDMRTHNADTCMQHACTHMQRTHTHTIRTSEHIQHVQTHT